VPQTPGPVATHVDVLIVGAGLSGIGAACQLRRDMPGASYAILEARAASGGTWDLFRFPGIRSDSDIFTFGYGFRPWRGSRTIASGAEILRYLRETAAEYGVDEHISYRTRVIRADWSSADARWTVTCEDTGSGPAGAGAADSGAADSGAAVQWTCSFLYLCTGYYRYDEGYRPDWPDRELFGGRIVHPQHWPADLDVTGKRVVVIGSGATAVTIVPAITAAAASVTMLQRSPSFVLALPGKDPVADLLRKVLPERRAYAAVRWKNARISTLMYGFCRSRPDRARAMLRKGMMKRLPPGFDVDTHFNPAYQPWDQRMCLVPDGDFFAAIWSGKADVVTGHIEAFTPAGLRLRSGAELAADVIVTATGLNLLPVGGIELAVDGDQVRVSDRIAYLGMMLDGVPNLAFTIGYTNASWTLKADLIAGYVTRLLRYMRDGGYAVVTPRSAGKVEASPFTEMTSGYFQRAIGTLPLQGDRAPWRLRQHYFKDAALFHAALKRAELEFRPAVGAVPSAATPAASL
jgi:monooxygenase